MAQQAPMQDLTALGALLKRNRNTPHEKPPVSTKGIRPLKPIATIGTDGIEHINADFTGLTELGQLLGFTSELSWTHPYKNGLFGQFSSIQRWWYWILSPNLSDDFRTIHWTKFGVKQSEEGVAKVPNFHAVIVDAMYHRVVQYPDIVNAIKENTLRYDTYAFKAGSEVDGVKTVPSRIRPKRADWYVAGLEAISTAIKTGKPLDLTPFINDKESFEKLGLYGVLEARIAELSASYNAESANIAEAAVAAAEVEPGDADPETDDADAETA